MNYFRTSDGSNEYIVKTRIQSQNASPSTLTNADDFLGSDEETGGPETPQTPLDDEVLSPRIEIKNTLDNLANMTTALPSK